MLLAQCVAPARRSESPGRAGTLIGEAKSAANAALMDAVFSQAKDKCNAKSSGTSATPSNPALNHPKTPSLALNHATTSVGSWEADVGSAGGRVGAE